MRTIGAHAAISQRAPDEPPVDRTPWWATVGIGLAAALLCLTRTVHPSERFSLWAEDGLIFSSAAHNQSVWHSLTATYAGYFALLPRVIALLASALPWRWEPVLYTGCATLVLAVLAALVHRAARRGLGFGPVAALLLAGFVLLLPAGGAEVFDNVTNLQWPVLATVAVYLAAWHDGWRTNPPVTALALFVAATTNPLTFILLPLVASRFIRSWRSGARRPAAVDIAVLSGLLPGIAIQYVGHVLGTSVVQPGHVDLGRLSAQFSARVVDQAVLGDRYGTSALFAVSTGAMVAIGAVAFVGLIAWALSAGPRRRLVLLLLLAALMLFGVEGYVRDLSAIPDLALGATQKGALTADARYFAVPAFLVTFAGLALLSPLSGPRGEDRTRRHRRSLPSSPAPVRELALLVFGVALLVNFPVNLQREPLGAWRAGLRAAQVTCHRHPLSIIFIPNAPSGFGTALTCAQAFRN